MKIKNMKKLLKLRNAVLVEWKLFVEVRERNNRHVSTCLKNGTPLGHPSIYCYGLEAHQYFAERFEKAVRKLKQLENKLGLEEWGE